MEDTTISSDFFAIFQVPGGDIVMWCVILSILLCVCVVCYLVFSAPLSGLFFKEHLFLGFMDLSPLSKDDPAKKANQDSQDPSVDLVDLNEISAVAESTDADSTKSTAKSTENHVASGDDAAREENINEDTNENIHRNTSKMAVSEQDIGDDTDAEKPERVSEAGNDF
ncbi:MAG: hypothetical protein OXC44_04355 [Proteobacteria bacterium]|nr:hypothetical protein [Pseudomonadota bacterium]